MYQCNICNTNYKLSPEQENEISKVNKDNPVVSTVVICPGCENKHIVGGELDFDEMSDRDIIMMFGFEYEERKHINLPRFNGIKIEVTQQEIIDFIRNEELLKLKDRVQILRIVADYYGSKVDGNEVNQILLNVFGR